MKILSWFLGGKTKPKKTVEEWKAKIMGKPDWELNAIARNPGEFVVEIRRAAAEILAQRIVG